MAYWNGTTWVPETLPTSPTRGAYRPRPFGAAVEASLIVILAFGLVAGTTFAAKPQTSEVWVNELSAASPSALGLGDAFSVGYQTREREPFALARCVPNETTEYLGTYADGSVWSAVFSVYAGGPTPQSFVLGASVYPLWVGGGADCQVDLVKYSRDLQRVQVLATTSFQAAP